jgi:outer membrane protein assembly factor BamB
MRARVINALIGASLTVLAASAAMPAAVAAPRAAPVNWPQFRFNQARTGVQPFEATLNASNVPTLRLSFSDQLGQLVDASSPAVVNGVAYIGSSDGTLWAYSANGCGQSLCTTPLWQSTNLAQILSSPTVAGGLVFVGSQTSFSSNDGKLNAFSAHGCGQSVCAPLWQGLAGPQSILESSPAVAGGTVFVGAFDGKLYAFSATGCGAATCQPLWTGSTGGTIESSPTVVNGTVYIGSDDGNLYAFKASGCGASTCQPLWKGSIGGPAFSSSPAVVGGKVFIGSDHFLSAFTATGCGGDTCQPLWQGANGSDFVNGSPAVFNKRVYIGLENGVGVFSAAGCGQALCAPLWQLFGSGAQAAVLSSPTVANGVVYAGRNTGEVLAWRAGPCGQTLCTQIWSGATNDQIVSSSPTVVNGKVYIGSADNLFPEDIQGRIYVFALPGD